MGSGKTTAARFLARELDYTLVEENFADNAFLPRFYKDMKRWAFHSQTFFLMEKMNQLLSIAPQSVQDTPIYQDVYSYAQAQHILGNIDDAEWKLYVKIFTSLEEHIPVPDAIIFLDVTVDEVIRRIKARDRSFEKKIPHSYIGLLDKLLRDWVQINKKIRIIQIPTDALNLVNNKKDQHMFMELVKNNLAMLQ